MGKTSKNVTTHATSHELEETETNKANDDHVVVGLASARLTQFSTSFPPPEWVAGFQKTRPEVVDMYIETFKKKVESDLKDDEAKRKVFLRGQAIAATLIGSGIVAIVVCVIVRPEVAGSVAWALATLTGGLSWLMLGGSKDKEQKKKMTK